MLGFQKLRESINASLQLSPEVYSFSINNFTLVHQRSFKAQTVEEDDSIKDNTGNSYPSLVGDSVVIEIAKNPKRKFLTNSKGHLNFMIFPAIIVKSALIYVSSISIIEKTNYQRSLKDEKQPFTQAVACINNLTQA